MFKCQINNEEWSIEEKEQEFILNKFNERKKEDEKATYMFGMTDMTERKIYINKEIGSIDQYKRTLYHELMHAYLWSVGVCSWNNYGEEDLCDFSSASHNLIDKIAIDYMEYRAKEGK